MNRALRRHVLQCAPGRPSVSGKESHDARQWPLAPPVDPGRALSPHPLGTAALRVPRSMNPFTVARRLQRAAKGITPDHDFARELAALATSPAKMKKNPGEMPSPSPDMDWPEPVIPEPAAEHGKAA
jgi:hypothetical protein